MSDSEEKPKPIATVKVVNPIDADKLRSDIGYSIVDLSNAMLRQASLYVEYARLHAQAERQVDDLELAIKVQESVVYRTHRDKAAGAGSKITDKHLDHLIASHPNVIRMKRALNEATQIVNIAKGAMKAFEQRKDMLIQLGAHERKEMDGDLRIYGKDAGAVERMKQRLEQMQGDKE